MRAAEYEVFQPSAETDKKPLRTIYFQTCEH